MLTDQEFTELFRVLADFDRHLSNDEENLIEAIIQKECTSIHPSVHWRFASEARDFIKAEMNGEQAVFNKIALIYRNQKEYDNAIKIMRRMPQ